MSVFQFILKEGISFTTSVFFDWIKHKGLDNIEKSDLDYLIEKTGSHVINISGFDFLYNIVSTKENNKMAEKTNRTMLKLTVITTGAAIVAILEAIIPILTKK